MTVITLVCARLLIFSQPIEVRLKVFVDYTGEVRESLD
jgi:hypothetical protein